MPDIRIRREHKLGIVKARKVAWAWAEDAEKKFEMECTVEEGDHSDTVHFKRTGVDGTLEVTAHAFELHAKLGFLLGAFSQSIAAEIEKQLDKQLGAATKAPAKAAKPAARSGSAVRAKKA